MNLLFTIIITNFFSKTRFRPKHETKSTAKGASSSMFFYEQRIKLLKKLFIKKNFFARVFGTPIFESPKKTGAKFLFFLDIALKKIYHRHFLFFFQKGNPIRQNNVSQKKLITARLSSCWNSPFVTQCFGRASVFFLKKNKFFKFTVCSNNQKGKFSNRACWFFLSFFFSLVFKPTSDWRCYFYENNSKTWSTSKFFQFCQFFFFSVKIHFR